MEKTGNVNHNHCVKADPQDPLPFCYTTDPNVRYEHCDCDDNQMGLNYPDYNYQDVYNGKSNGYGGGANSGNGYGYNGNGPYGGSGPYGGPGPYGGNSRAGQQGRCKVSRTISGNVMFGLNSQAYLTDYSGCESQLGL